jgi:hypothetical protein
VPLRDSDIRAPLHGWLRRCHPDASDTAIIHELKMPRPSARVDIAVVNGQICAFEIKSDVDSLARLPRQIRAFSRVFDHVSVVTTERHLDNAQELVPDWWGLVATAGEPNGFVVRRPSSQNPTRDSVSLIHLLTRQEIKDILVRKGFATGIRTKPRRILVCTAIESFDEEGLRDEVRAALKRRHFLHSPPSPPSPNAAIKVSA